MRIMVAAQFPGQIRAQQLYRRHSKACKANRPEDSRTGKFEEGRRNWKKCSCQIFASGTLGGKFKRQCTENWEWDKAEVLVSSCIS